jgi:hypothetical protein
VILFTSESFNLFSDCDIYLEMVDKTRFDTWCIEINAVHLNYLLDSVGEVSVCVDGVHHQIRKCPNHRLEVE